MNRQPVESDVVQSIGFADGRLEVEIGGQVYQCEATQQDFDDFLAAESKGRHLKVFRGRLLRVEEQEEVDV